MNVEEKIKNAEELGVPPDFVYLNTDNVYISVLDEIMVMNADAAIEHIMKLVRNKIISLTKIDIVTALVVYLENKKDDEDESFFDDEEKKEQFSKFEKELKYENQYEYDFYVKRYDDKTQFFADKLEESANIITVLNELDDSYQTPSITFLSIIKKISIEDDRGFPFAVDNAILFFNEFVCTPNIPYLEYRFEETKVYKKVYSNISEKTLPKDENYRTDVFIMKVILEGKVYECIINFKNSTIEIECEENNLKDIQKYIKNSLKNIKFFDDEKLMANKGEFEIDVDYIHPYLFYLCTMIDSDENFNIIKELIYVSEKYSPWMNKKRTTFIYRDPYHIFYDSSKIFLLKFTIEEKQNRYIVRFKTKTEDISYVNNFAKNLSKILTYYYTQDWIRDIASEIFNLGEKIHTTVSREKKVTKLSYLRNKASGVFPKATYSKECECKFQPIVIDEEDIEDWEDYDREVLEFPHPKFGLNTKYYVCPSDEFKYFTLKPNGGDNNKQYPFLPCCISTNKHVSESDEYLEYSMDIKKNSKKTEKNYIKKTDAPLDDGQLGILNLQISNYLRSITGLEFRRRGSTNDKDSLMSCILYCIQSRDEELYKKYNTDNYRKIIYNEVENELMYQEFFGLNSKKLLMKKDYYIDSKFFLRPFEYLFKLNIIIFDNDEIEIPNAEGSHVRNIINEYPTIMLYKNRKKYEDQPVYEIIEAIDGRNIFDNLSEKFKSVIDTSYYVINDGKVYMAPYNKIEWFRILKNHEVVSQFFNNGKVISFNIRYKDNIITIFTPPTVPFNVKKSSTIYYTNKKTCIELFGNSYEEASEGLTYSLGEVPYKVFIPCEEKLNGETYDNYIYQKNIKQKDITKQLIEIKKRSAILRQLVAWCKQHSTLNLSDWIRKYVEVVDKYEIKFYKIPFQLPSIFKNTEEAITYLEPFCNAFENNKILLYNSLLLKLIKYLDNMHEVINKGKFQTLFNIFNKLSDFSQIDNNIIFTTQKEYNKWVKSNFNNEDKIKYSITDEDYSEDFFLFEDKNKKLFIVQTVKKDELSWARVLGELWLAKGRNFGHDLSTKYTLSELEKYRRKPYIIFRFFDELKIIKDNSENSDEFIYIYLFSKNRYAVMLPIF